MQFDPVLEEDAGIYTCRYDDGSKALVETSPYTLDVLPPGSLPAAGAAALAILACAIAWRLRRTRLTP